MAKATPAEFFGHPDGVAPPFNKTPSNDPSYQPKLGNISAMLTGPAAKRDDPGATTPLGKTDPLDGQFDATDRSSYVY